MTINLYVDITHSNKNFDSLDETLWMVFCLENFCLGISVTFSDIALLFSPCHMSLQFHEVCPVTVEDLISTGEILFSIEPSVLGGYHQFFWGYLVAERIHKHLGYYLHSTKNTLQYWWSPFKVMLTVSIPLRYWISSSVLMVFLLSTEYPTQNKRSPYTVLSIL